MTDLKNCFFCLSGDNIPYLQELMEELVSLGVSIYSVDPCTPFSRGPVPSNSYTITDNKAGINFARLYDTGYIILSPDSGAPVLHDTGDAQCIIEGLDEITGDFVEKMYQRKNNIPWTIALTERTIIRELSLSDIDRLFTLYEDSEIQRFIPPLLSTKEEETEFQRAYIEKMYGFFGYGFWNVIDRKTGGLIGRAGISNREGFDDPEIGYLLSAPFRHRGIATEVCFEVIRYAREILGFTTLNAFIRPDNVPSIKFAEKMGFTPSGETIESCGHVLNRFFLRL